MGLFDKVQQAADVTVEGDVVRGQKRAPLESDIYNLIIKAAFGQTSAKGAVGINLHLEAQMPDGQDNRLIKITEWITTGDAKGNVPYYERNKTDAAGNVTGKEKVELPGFANMNALAKLLTGKSIIPVKDAAGNVVTCQTVEERTISLYDSDKKQEVPTKVQMFTELVGKGVCGCVLHRIEDRNVKNPQTGEYEPSGKTYETNVIEKFLDPKDRKTLAEKENNVAADFQAAWLAKWKGQVDNQAKGAATAGTAGMPGAPAGNGAAPTGSAAPADGGSLFG